MPYPVVDLHCDLLTYLASVENAHPGNTQDIGCAIPYLREGLVKLQMLAVYSGGGRNGAELTETQCRWFQRLAAEHRESFHKVGNPGEAREAVKSAGTGIIVSIENASSLCGEDEPLERSLERLELVRRLAGPPLYVSLTHHGANRFGGGNTTSSGLTDDGRYLLDHLAGTQVAVDLSHASDALAYDILNHIERRDLDLPVLASHSNFRAVFDHPRNLPDDLARAVIDRNGLIGMNFLRALLHPDDPSYLTRHILHGMEMGAERALALGADYFYDKGHPDTSRAPFFFPEHADAGKCQSILRSLEPVMDPEQVSALASENALGFMKRVWQDKSR